MVFRVGGRLVVPIFHTAAALRSVEMMNQLREDFRRLPDIAAGKSLAEEVLTKFSEEKKKPPQPRLF
jgi:hypothetical protein